MDTHAGRDSVYRVADRSRTAGAACNWSSVGTTISAVVCTAAARCRHTCVAVSETRRTVAGLLVRPVVRAPEVEAREGIEDLLRDGALEGIGATEEMAIISGVVQFGDKTARDVMTPASELFSLDEALPPMEIARRLAAAAYSRVPIYRGAPDNVVGMIHAFDVLRVAGERMPPLRPVTFATESKPASELLFEMLRARRHLAIVRNTHALISGVVTLEDLLEELVGDIRDEHDEPAPRAAGSPS